MPSRANLVAECRRVLLLRISAGEWTEFLPGERRLAELLQVGRGTRCSPGLSRPAFPAWSAATPCPGSRCLTLTWTGGRWRGFPTARNQGRRHGPGLDPGAYPRPRLRCSTDGLDCYPAAAGGHGADVAGFKVPKHLSLIMLSREPCLEYLVPHIAGYQLDPTEVAHLVIRCLERLLSGGYATGGSPWLVSSEVKGDSVGPPAGLDA